MNRFSGFRQALGLCCDGKTAEAVELSIVPPLTPLKRGVNEREMGDLGNPFNPFHSFNLFTLLTSLLLLTHSAQAAAVTAPARLVWPAPPDEPRIAFVRSIEGPADLGIKPSGWAKLGRWLAGNNPESEQLVKPFGIALDDQGNLCLTDTGANAVAWFDKAHKTWHRWEKAGEVRFASPVAVAKQGRTFYVADSGLGAVVAFTETGALLFQIKGELERPAGLAISSNRLFVVDSKRHEVLIYELQGRLSGRFGTRGSGPGEFNFPTHIAAGGAGELYVTDSLNNRVQAFDTEGRFLRQVGSIGDAPGHFSRPKGAAVDTYGHLYVLDALFGNVQLFDREGRLLMTLGQGGSQPGEFWLPNGIVISRNNEIYVADSYNHRVQVFQFIGQP